MGALHLGSEGYSTDGVNGKVGIGTNNPAQPLTVSGVIRALSASDSRYRSDHFVGSDQKGHINAYDDTGGVSLPLYIDASPVVLNYSSGGNVGVNCSNPGEKLEVGGAIKLGAKSGTANGTLYFDGTYLRLRANNTDYYVSVQTSAPY